MRTDLHWMVRILQLSPSATRWGQKTAYVNAADDLGHLLVFGEGLCDANNDDKGTALIANGVYRRQSTRRTDHGRSLASIDEHRLIEGERDIIRVGGRTDQSDDGRADGLDRPGSGVYDDSLDAVKKIGKGHLVLSILSIGIE
jgi:hypothetical protein